MLAPKKQLTCILPFLGKKSLQLRSCLANSVDKTVLFLQFESRKQFFDLNANQALCFGLTIPLVKRSAPFLFICTRVITVTLLISVKRTSIFSLELRNIWVFLILLENGQEISKILPVQIIYPCIYHCIRIYFSQLQGSPIL